MISIQNLSYTYPKAAVPTLTGLNAQFEAGQFTTIVGKSGAGKSTLLALLAGLCEPSQGTVSLGETDIRGLNKDTYRSKHVGVVFQNYNLLANATALDNITLAMSIGGVKGDKKSKAFALLAQVGIDQTKALQPITKLSGGQRQRVSIARGLSNNPSVIIADEPTANLDQLTSNGVVKVLQNLAHEHGKTVIMVTHSGNVAKLSDTTYQLSKGGLTCMS